ncbi:MAG: hypothetical protein KAS04_03005 [Candidatus Aenigmarchaeota archaeon]|nr:hypothetical protein [Candidatus Aenigmarchaeota archaeon]
MVITTILKKMLISRGFTTDKGRIKMFGKMDWTLFPSRALAIIFQDVGKKLGKDYLYDIGFKAGSDTGDEIIHATGSKPKGGWITMKLVVSLLEFIGYGTPVFVKSDIEKDGHHHLLVHVSNNPITEWGVKLYGKKSLVCNWVMGVYAGHAECELGAKNVRVKESRCIKDGHPYCEWESKW